VVGLAAAAITVGIGSAMLVKAPSLLPRSPTGPTAERITVSTAAPSVPLSAPQIVDLLTHRPDLGELGDAVRRASCLNGLGYPATATVLGGKPVHVNGHGAVLLVLPGDTPRQLAVLVVPQNCTSADSGLIADTRIPRP
jgi:hypothetical protein